MVNASEDGLLERLRSLEEEVYPHRVETPDGVDAGFETLQARPQVRERADEGDGSKDTPFVVPATVESALANGTIDGKVDFGQGWFKTTGLQTDASRAYDETAVYLSGDGIRATTLLHAADEPTTPTISLEGSGGNFGGVTDMTVYGAGEEDESGTADIVYSDGDVIDAQFRNLIVRYGGGNGIHIVTSSSGTRITNCWIENYGDSAIRLGSGNRVKVDNVHSIGGKMLHCGVSESQFSNLTLIEGRGENGIRVTSSGNSFSNILLRNSLDNGFQLSADDGTQITNLLVADTSGSGIISGSPFTVANMQVDNVGSEYGMGIRQLGDGAIINALIGGNIDTGYSDQLLRLSGDANYVNGVTDKFNNGWTISIADGATENVIDNVLDIPYANITDEGTRTLINRWGTNAGDPSATGEWNGFASYAGRLGASVWDTSTTPWTPYTATPDGSSWVAL
jgi:hypothetical protein